MGCSDLGGPTLVVPLLGLALVAEVIVGAGIARVVISLGVQVAVAAPVPSVASALTFTVLSHRHRSFLKGDGGPKFSGCHRQVGSLG